MTSEQLLETETRLSLRLGRYGSQTGVGLPLLQCCVSLSVCFSSVLAWIGFAVARNKDACPSHPRVLESDLLLYCCLLLLRVPLLLLLLLPLLPLLLLLLLLLASAAGASVAAAAAAALFVRPALCFIFYSNSSAKAI